MKSEYYIILEKGLYNQYRLIILQYNEDEKDRDFIWKICDIFEHDELDVLRDHMKLKYPNVIGVVTDGQPDIPDEITPWEAAELALVSPILSQLVPLD